MSVTSEKAGTLKTNRFSLDLAAEGSFSGVAGAKD